MQIIANDYFEKDYVKSTEGVTLFVSSECYESCEFIKKILNSEIFEQNDVAFKATGLLDNLNKLITNAELEGITVCEGDGHRIIVKKYPECYGIVSNKQVGKIIDEWVCTMYERRFIFVFDNSNLDKIRLLLQETVYDENFAEKLWPYLKLMIENAADAPNHNSFIISYKKDFVNLIQNILKNYEI